MPQGAPFKLRRRPIAGAALAMLLSAAHAWCDPGTVGADFLRVPAAPVPTSLGGAYVSLAGPDSLFYNPAGLGLLETPVVSAAHNEYFEGLRQEYLVFAYPAPGIGTFSLGGSYLHSGAIQAVDESDQAAGDFSLGGGVGILSFARSFPQPSRLTPRKPWQSRAGGRPGLFSLGASLKWIHESLADVSGRTFAADFGALVRLPLDLRVGASVSNLGRRHRLDQEAFPLPLQVRVGISRGFQVEDGPAFHLAADTLKDTGRKREYMAGLEASPFTWFNLRAGYRTEADAGSGFSLGFGLATDWPWETIEWLEGIRVDYAYSDAKPLQATHRVGVQLKW